MEASIGRGKIYTAITNQAANDKQISYNAV